MKIGIYDPYLDDLGGGEKYMMTIALCLAQKHDVVVFWDNEADLRALEERFLLDFSSIKRGKNIFATSVNFLERLMHTRDFDAIFTLSDGSVPFVLAKKLFIHFQQPMQHMSVLPAKTKYKLSRVNKIFCNSHFTKSFIDKTFGVKSFVVYPPVDLMPAKTKKENIILHVGRLRMRDITVNGEAIGDFKKQSVMINVFKEMVKDGLKNWRFVLAVSVREEDEEAFKELQVLASGFPIEFLVNKNNKLLWNTYNRAKIYWHATGYGEDFQKHPEYTEHFGISTVEAMGAGVVPVVINAGGQQEIIIDGKNGFLWNTLSELKERTLFLTQNEKERKNIAIASQKRAKDFGRNIFSQKIYELLET